MSVQGFVILVENAERMRSSALSFLLTSGAADNAAAWAALSDSDRAAVKTQYAAAGIKLIVSAFGATDTPTSAGTDATTAATTMANWVKKYNLDGIDVDYEVNIPPSFFLLALG